MHFSGSISCNRVTIGLPPLVRQDLVEEARQSGLRVPELVRHLLLRWYAARHPRDAGVAEIEK